MDEKKADNIPSLTAPQKEMIRKVFRIYGEKIYAEETIRKLENLYKKTIPAAEIITEIKEQTNSNLVSSLEPIIGEDLSNKPDNQRKALARIEELHTKEKTIDKNSYVALNTMTNQVFEYYKQNIPEKENEKTK